MPSVSKKRLDTNETERDAGPDGSITGMECSPCPARLLKASGLSASSASNSAIVSALFRSVQSIRTSVRRLVMPGTVRNTRVVVREKAATVTAIPTPRDRMTAAVWLGLRRSRRSCDRRLERNMPTPATEANGTERPGEAGASGVSLSEAAERSRREAATASRQKKSGRRDSNPRPSAPKADALPGCATPRHALDYPTRGRHPVHRGIGSPRRGGGVEIRGLGRGGHDCSGGAQTREVPWVASRRRRGRLALRGRRRDHPRERRPAGAGVDLPHRRSRSALRDEQADLVRGHAARVSTARCTSARRSAASSRSMRPPARALGLRSQDRARRHLRRLRQPRRLGVARRHGRASAPRAAADLRRDGAVAALRARRARRPPCAGFGAAGMVDLKAGLRIAPFEPQALLDHVAAGRRQRRW